MKRAEIVVFANHCFFPGLFLIYTQGCMVLQIWIYYCWIGEILYWLVTSYLKTNVQN